VLTSDEKVYETEPPMLADLEVSDRLNTDVAGFKDIKPMDWFAPDIMTLIEMGVRDGFSDNTMRPSSHITRAEFTKMLFIWQDNWRPDELMAPSFNDVKNGHWAFAYIEEAKARGILTGCPGKTFKPDTNATMAEASKMIFEACFF
jgi:hypothetical protein